MSNPLIVHSSLLGDSIAVSVDSVDLLEKPRFLLLKIIALENGNLIRYQSFGASVLGAVANAQKKLPFDVLIAYGSDGRSFRRYMPPPEVANAPEDILSYCAQLRDNKLIVQCLEDSEDQQSDFTRLMSVEVRNGEILIFQGSCLSDLVRNVRRFFTFSEIFFDEPPKPQKTKKPTLHPHMPRALPPNDLWSVTFR